MSIVTITPPHHSLNPKYHWSLSQRELNCEGQDELPWIGFQQLGIGHGESRIDLGPNETRRVRDVWKKVLPKEALQNDPLGRTGESSQWPVSQLQTPSSKGRLGVLVRVLIE